MPIIYYEELANLFKKKKQFNEFINIRLIFIYLI